MIPMLLKRGAAGFLMGTAVSAVMLWCAGVAKDEPAQLLLSGFYGACCMGGTALYRIERWPLLKSTALHWMITALPFAPIALSLGWADGLPALLLMEAGLLAGFLLIWTVMYLRCKARVRELNKMLEKNHQRKKECYL